MPKGKTRKELIKRYDDNLGFPTPDMVKMMKESVDTINNMKTFADWYKVRPFTSNILKKNKAVSVWQP